MRFLSPGRFRLFLALIVVLHHSTPLRLGAWAVGLFFCLSGFWIAEMWDRKYRLLDRPYLEFVVSRWWRVAPLLMLTTLLAAALMHWGVAPGDTGVLSRLGWWATQPAVVGSTWVGRLLPPAWSLDVEMQFYVVAPLLMMLISRVPWSAAVAFMSVAIGWCWLATARGSAGEAARLDIWIGVFLAGILASLAKWRPSRRVMVFSAIATVATFALAAMLPTTRAWIVLRGSTGHALTGSLAATLTVGTIALAMPFAIGTTRLTSTRFDRWLGDLSYSLYLFHWLPRNWYYAHLVPQSPMQTAALLLLANIMMAVVGAVILLSVVDRPIQWARARWVKKQYQSALPSSEAVEPLNESFSPSDALAKPSNVISA